MDLSVSDLRKAFSQEPAKPKYKTLCENIFDVSRADLLTVVASLRDAFWSDNAEFGLVPSTLEADAVAEQAKMVRAPAPLSTHAPSSPTGPVYVDDYQGPSSPSPPPASPSPPHYTTAASYFPPPTTTALTATTHGAAIPAPMSPTAAPMAAQIPTAAASASLADNRRALMEMHAPGIASASAPQAMTVQMWKWRLYHQLRAHIHGKQTRGRRAFFVCALDFISFFMRNRGRDFMRRQGRGPRLMFLFFFLFWFGQSTKSKNYCNYGMSTKRRVQRRKSIMWPVTFCPWLWP
ncbi:hypothetical protein BC940DRAFT_314089 [Gongronella butleri]|nr:hypothetical protein BC940DRAFT_314089 [Gongronella butleri]